MKILRPQFDFEVTQANYSYSETFELDKNIDWVLGIQFTSNKDDLLYLRGSQKIEINKEEFFPEKYASKLLMSGINVAPNLRYYDIGKVNSGNKSIKIEYKDKDDGRSVFSPYTVSVYLLCQSDND
jgi:hypothetical protein